eukprot:g30025.t1
MRWPLRQSNILQCGAEAEHHRMCLAAGSSEKVAEDGSAARDPHEVFRVFYDSACEKKSLVTFEGERKFYWTISTDYGLEFTCAFVMWCFPSWHLRRNP